MRLLFGFLLLLGLCSCGSAGTDTGVNPILGDESFRATFGETPSAETDEQLRLQTHLAYVEQRLRAKDVSNWPLERQQQRAKMLDLLKTYRLAGAFPRNYDYPGERKPCFIDRDGNICAVGYLVAQTAGWEVAEAINEKYQYENLLAMNDASLDAWVAQSGLTKRECAMIQPTYGSPTPITYTDIPTAYGISSSAAIGLNLSLSTLNGIQLGQGSSRKVLPWMGLVSGIGQAVLGVTQLRGTRTEDASWWSGTTYVNAGKRNLSFMNIGLGTATAFLSSWNLFSNKNKKKVRNVRWDLRSYNLPDQSWGGGIGFTKRL